MTDIDHVEETLTPIMGRLARYRLDMKERDRLCHKGNLTADEAATINHANSFDYAGQLADDLSVAGSLARDLARRVEALEADVRGVRAMNGVQRRAIEAYEADRLREGRHGSLPPSKED